MANTNFKEYKVWDAPIRIFHWVNFISVISLIFVALVMMYKKELGITGVDAKIALKELHVIIGYIFVMNLVWRIIWGFIGGKYARWSYIFPGKDFIKAVRNYIKSIADGDPQQYIGHNPLGRLAISTIILLLLLIASTGLIRAGTDIYYPPFGSYVVEYIAKPGINPDSIIPYNPTGMSESKANHLKVFKSPFGKIHKYSAYALMFIIIIHIFVVVLTEIREGGSLITAMFTGRKLLRKKPADLDS
ncbi:MAG: cytochrome b/b6 domain-containing protein [Candidatus Thiodiazotropha sp. (ex Lucinoma borealis)]|nr:cytochrome b/b6 domain-containing protein [Candidatus Thiodiazotropha sp. (ex Lucinoma borealis)]MCU7854686.1 cytochrome b/b6 domain-containing protein [Candidatus Thiodiazotropha sp. (ex Lucinoma borealis)]MCU7867863.1 cytochrome b/b6 domain-containing protein [Candidatus Thiodiazotropha sp. (ex Lucinoma borealis)]